jgi:hypothetical protein
MLPYPNARRNGSCNNTNGRAAKMLPHPNTWCNQTAKLTWKNLERRSASSGFHDLAAKMTVRVESVCVCACLCVCAHVCGAFSRVCVCVSCVCVHLASALSHITNTPTSVAASSIAATNDSITSTVFCVTFSAPY